jgi:hypothetical protein
MMLIRFWSGVALLTAGLLTLLLGVFVLGVQFARSPLPPLLYARDSRLYRAEVGCGSLIANCEAGGRTVVDDLYSIGVSLWSPDGQRVAVHRNAGWTIYEADCLRTGTACAGMLLDADFNESRPTGEAGSGALLAVYAHGTMLQRHPSSCWQQSSAPCTLGSVFLDQSLLLYQPHASVDGQQIILSDLTGSAFVIFQTRCFNEGRWACADPAHQQFILVPQRPASWPTFSHDGQSVLFYADTSGVGVGEQLFVMDVNSHSFQQITFRKGASLYPAWTEDSQTVAFAGFATPNSRFLDLYLLDRRYGLVVRLVRASNSNITYPAWQPAPE